MAEFCNNCADNWGMPSPDIDVYAIHGKLNKGEYEPVLCEGCNMVAVMKDKTGALKVGHPDNNIINWSEYQPLNADDQFTRVNKTIVAYHNILPSEPTKKDWEAWLETLEEPMRSSFSKMGFEYGKNALPFKRYYLEIRDYGMRDYMRKNLSAEDFEHYLKMFEGKN